MLRAWNGLREGDVTMALARGRRSLPLLSEGRVRAKTLPRNRGIAAVRQGAVDYLREEHPTAGHGRPRTWGECLAMGLGTAELPCPWVSCEAHLCVEVTESGSLREVWPDRDVTEAPATCALTIAAEGGHTLDDVGRVLNLTRERMRQIEKSALPQLRDTLESMGVDRSILEDLDRATGGGW